ncbi:ParB/RepB/Spo0J family partition protein [Xylella taiwanensis]|uniref:Probable chromosome-partitioning protein ParB n=1 Tax=Xylella taiwanensis TaxID=1444770 RepID=Z9JJ18_9GAMM|nr:ParB/RepB/Spo0J family partition protein [Xylella taiwanensis]AXI83791.1 chromosome partitioning protein ParB [Xylella taiwanensis]EWS78164.1 chromosome partitioning protein ParB [Xylella taiwanensis]MCD8456894.1 ParB/RepB/Spo0J family partition protein [Xylella taiwanensis]MCD8459306.1 ParB/RepB/Spo0J family partition protein [Xylella taiwanensis]MCD8461823.1 ParB/RepB/Spo0J family partition protein [Xylella taiwanensis]
MNKPSPPLKKRGLGRGLEALLGSKGGSSVPPTLAEEQFSDEELRTLQVTQLQPSKYQPRREMNDVKLTELAESIKAQGVIQPIIVRELALDMFEIVAGERRWRASQLAGLSEVPVLVRELDDRTVIAMALIENIQREDLNPLEEAQALQRLIDEFSLTHAEAAEAVGRSRAAVSNLLRLLELPVGIRTLLESRQLEMGHARALLTLAPELATKLAKEVVDQGWSVREVEHRAQQFAAGKVPDVRDKKAKPAASISSQPDIASLEIELSERLGTKVAINHGRAGKGKLVIHYTDLDVLDGVLERLRTRAAG